MHFRALNTHVPTHMHTHASNTFPNGFTSYLDDADGSRINTSAVPHTQTRTHTQSVIPLTSNKLVVALWLMLLSPPPSFPLNHRHTQTSPFLPDSFLVPLSSMLSYHTVIIYPHSYNSLFYASIHLSALHTYFPPFNSLSLLAALHLPLPSSLSRSQCPIGGMPSKICTIVINGFDLFARLSLHPPFALSLSRPRHFQCDSLQRSGLSIFINQIKSKCNLI